MSGLNLKRSITNRTDTRRDHHIQYITTSPGRRASALKTLKAGETMDIEDGDRLIIISDRETNYAIQWENGAPLCAIQVNNNHPKFAGKTVVSYHLASMVDNSDNVEKMKSGTQRDDDDPDNGNGPVIIVITEPNEPEP